MNKLDLREIKTVANKVNPTIGTSKSEYGKITSDVLTYKDKSYKIRYIQSDSLVVNTDKLFGKYGDEFPLELIR